MQAFRALVIGTLNIVAFILFLAAVVIGAVGGYQGELLVPLYEMLGINPLPAAANAVIGGVVAYLLASVTFGLIFILLDIQDGIRDLIRIQSND